MNHSFDKKKWLSLIENKMYWIVNQSKQREAYLKNLNDVLSLINIALNTENKPENHQVDIINNNKYESVDKSGKSGDKLLLFKKKNENNFVALVKILMNYNNNSNPVASKIKEVVNSYYMGEKYNKYFPKIYDIQTKDNNLYINMELVNGTEFTNICKKINIDEMKQILFVILHALIEIKNDKVFFKHYDIHPDNIMVQKVEPYTILFDDKKYKVNYNIKFIDLGQSFVFTDVDSNKFDTVSKTIIENFDIGQREVPLASYKCSDTYKSIASFNIVTSSILSVLSNEKKYTDIDLYFIKELFNYIYQVICKKHACENDLNVSMTKFLECKNLEECAMNNFFDSILQIKGGYNIYYYKYNKYKQKYKTIKNKIQKKNHVK